MDHLPIPHSPIRSHPQIAVATKQSDSPGSFLTYPSRHAALLNGDDATGEREGTGVSSHDIIDYHQGWLFFALLSEFLGPLYDSQRYVDVAKEEDGEDDSQAGAADLWEEVDEEDDEEGEEEVETHQDDAQTLVLSTKHLHEDLARWRREGPLSNITEGDDYHVHLTDCLDAAFAAFDELESIFSGFIEAFPDHFLCLASVAEALDSAIVTAIDDGPIENIPSCATSFPSPAKRDWLQKISTILDLNNPELPLREPMLQAGWCPADISRMKDSFSSIAASYYFSNFQPSPSTPNLHDDCPSYACAVPHSAQTHPTHLNDLTDSSCDCPGTITFDEDELIPIYEQPNTIPCFTVGLTDSGGVAAAFTSISLSPEDQQDPENRYVVVSHVWSQGLGNPGSNALPFCKLSTIQYWAALARQVVAGQDANDDDERESETQTVNLWIDTMCVPVTPGRGRNLALAKMRDIYANASAVLVKSTEMEETQVEGYVEHPEQGVVDLSARLYLSDWMRRLWTLPEAVLAGMQASNPGGGPPGGRLVFGFGGGLLSLESVVGLLKQAPKHEAGLARQMIGEFVELTPMLFGFDDDDDEEKASGNYLACLTTALKYRGVSVASDELICLATLVGVPVQVGEGKVPLVGDATGTAEEGMGEVWKVIERKNKGIPADVIFSSVPRVDADGFRWAPRTFIQHARYGDVYWSSSDDGDGEDGESAKQPGRITQQGLEVKFPGARLQVDLKLYGTPLLRNVPGSQLKDRAQRVMFMQIPPGGEDWYSIHIQALDGLEDSFENLNLRPSLVELVGSGKVALILKQGQPEGKGLLVTIKDDSLPSVHVRSEYPVTIGSVSPPTAYICSAVQQNIGRIRAAAKTSEALMRRELSKLMSRQEILRDALVVESMEDSPSEEQLITTFVKTANLVAELGGVGGTAMGSDQSWIVD
ncbi:hypothetical protein QBC42DRAFT_315563 [Cladorrhinum samala]|uniref:Heterokaryon incompatibility domain-containing protein n=1 Tax=Cladorrhinum samala TaxID=585594 RepID=A0AAV9HCR7_9PEZI|nr:hypothetical protein QBC42DRAFT_315563 [Cladorrhinum samala]